jgi:hypothetical protein
VMLMKWSRLSCMGVVYDVLPAPWHNTPRPRRSASTSRPSTGSSATPSTCRRSTSTVRARPGRLSALSVFYSKSVLYGGFVWARRALNSPN